MMSHLFACWWRKWHAVGANVMADTVDQVWQEKFSVETPGMLHQKNVEEPVWVSSVLSKHQALKGKYGAQTFRFIIFFAWPRVTWTASLPNTWQASHVKRKGKKLVWSGLFAVGSVWLHLPDSWNHTCTPVRYVYRNCLLRCSRVLQWHVHKCNWSPASFNGLLRACRHGQFGSLEV